MSFQSLLKKQQITERLFQIKEGKNMSWEQVAQALYQILDNIDTEDDHCKEDNKAFRKLVMQHQARKNQFMASHNGQTVVRVNEENLKVLGRDGMLSEKLNAPQLNRSLITEFAKSREEEWDEWKDESIFPTWVDDPGVVSEEDLETIQNYMYWGDKPTEEIGDAISRAMQNAKPSITGIILHRTMRVKLDFINNILKSIKTEGSSSIDMAFPSSWSGSLEGTNQFAKEKGIRGGTKNIRVIISAKAPKGTIGLVINDWENIGHEVMLPGHTKVIIDKVEKEENIYFLHGVIRAPCPKSFKGNYESDLNESMTDWARNELNLVGLFDKDSDYEGMLGEAVIGLIEKFAEAGHSGFSAGLTAQLFDRLVHWKPLTELTNDPREWNDVSEMSDRRMYQSRRSPTCFSEDGGLTYYDLDEMTEVSEHGSNKKVIYTSKQKE